MRSHAEQLYATQIGGVKMSKPVIKNQKQKKNSVCLCNIKGCSLLKTQHIGHLFYYGIAVLGM